MASAHSRSIKLASEEEQPVIEEDARIELNAPVNTVWQIVNSINDWEKWNASIESAERLTAGNWIPGFRFRQKSDRERLEFVYTITEVALGQRASWTGSRVGLTRGMSVELRSCEGGAEVELKSNASGVRTMGPLGFLVQRGMRRRLNAWTDGLRKALSEQPALGAG